MNVSSSDKFGKLSSQNSHEVSTGSHKRIIWDCECGRTSNAPICEVLNGHTTSCGKCNFLSSEHWRLTKYGKLRMKSPEECFGGSRKKRVWVCDCGNETEVPTLSVFRGHTISCGRCNTLTAEHFASTKYGKLRMEFPESILPGSHKKVVWRCDCGDTVHAAPYSVIPGHTSSCGKCNLLGNSHWNNTLYGRLIMLNPGLYHKGSNKRVEWLCKCGKITEVEIFAVTSGKVKSCGLCIASVHEWYATNEKLIRELKTPIRPEDIPNGNFRLLETVTNTEIRIRAKCGVCGNEYKPIWGNIRQGRSMTCGCASVHVSSAGIAVANFVKSTGVDVFQEYELNKLKYDVAVESKKLLIEYHGLKWHSAPASKKRDLKKYMNAIDSEWTFISIFEDEWKHNRLKVENLIRNRLRLSQPKPLRPSQCEIRSIPPKLADPFYEIHHYIGAGRAQINYGIYFKDELIGCCSFKRPTRQTIIHPWELIRMVSHSGYRVHGIWSKILKMFVKEYSPVSIVSYSDNRLFDGSVYQKIGFKYDGDVRPDYYWCKDGRRHHKSGLRKPNGYTGGTEKQLRESEGYRKVFDLGKKRWVFTTSSPEPL